MRVAVFGLGSIGLRHATNIEALGHKAQCVDPAFGINELDRPDAIVIATPAASHIELARPYFYLPTFIEKPLSHDLQTAELFAISKPSNRIQVGYQLRFVEKVREFQRELRGKRVTSARLHFSQALSEWRPGRKDAGTGILLEASHELDLLRYLFGEWESVVGYTQRVDPSIDVEDVAIAIVQTYAGITVEVHLDMVQPGYERFIQASGPNLGRQTFLSKDDMPLAYLEEMRAFLDGSREIPGLDDGLAAIRLAEAIRKSAETGTRVYNLDAAEVEMSFSSWP